MKVLICKSLFFLTLLLIGSQVLVTLFVYHPFWGAPLYISKYDRFFRSTAEYDAVFIGSSRTFRNIDPFVFDSITGLTSFNFGIEEVGSPFNYFLANKVIDSKKADQIKYLIVELFSPEGNLPKELMMDVNHTNKALFWYEPTDFIFSLRALIESQSLSVMEKYNEIVVHQSTLFQSLFKIGHVQRILDSRQKQMHDLYMGKRLDGYYSYDDEIKTMYGNYLEERQQKIRQDSVYFDERRACSSDNYLSQLGKTTDLKFHREYVEELNKRCEEKGILLILNLQPRMTMEQCNYFHYFDVRAIQGIPVLDYSNSDHYPEFYQLENVFDQGHLNTKGAKLFTTTLSTDFNNILSQRNQ